MKFLTLFSVLVAALLPLAAVSLKAQEVDADEAWRNLVALDRAESDPAQRPAKEAEFVKWNETRLRRFLDSSLAFYDAYPKDPRRWLAVSGLLVREPVFVGSYLPAFDRNPTPSNVVVDELAKGAWLERRGRLIAEILADPKAAREAREAALIASVYDRLERDEVFSSSEVERLLGTFDKEFSDSRRLPQLAGILMRGLEQSDSENADRLWRALRKARNRELRKTADGKLRLIEARTKPLRLSFTAFDKRNVDLDDLRGKVVAIVFWAMWNGPSLTELQNLKKLYGNYHEAGFEIVGVSLDGAESADRLRLFLASNEIPWPQFFDGRGWKSRLAVKYSVSTAPFLLVLDKKGRVVSTRARGRKLEEIVKTCLEAE